MPTHLSILVSVASPLDYARYRHASLYFEFENDNCLKSALMEVVGSPGFFTFSERGNSDLPILSTSMYHAFLFIYSIYSGFSRSRIEHLNTLEEEMLFAVTNYMYLQILRA